MTKELEARLQVIEDTEAIKNLKATYCYLVDAGVAGDASKLDELVDLFTEDARCEYGDYATLEGKEAVGQFFKELIPSVLSYSAHMVHNPIIEVDGDSAKGKWYFEAPCTFTAANRATWAQGKYIEEYVKVDGIWKWKSLKVVFDYFTSFDEGWVITKDLIRQLFPEIK